eukprot:TRINITY_DN15595_c0_g1_i1.p1 TRINITY_DN15595_c0_g1~~TRINITY_DN15595_c0_g1_i1.p1  ORF type:complete len:280 (+),score=39.82 TRINITY_DN15595_c0_g1_i1:2-841(+)
MFRETEAGERIGSQGNNINNNTNNHNEGVSMETSVPLSYIHREGLLSSSAPGLGSSLGLGPAISMGMIASDVNRLDDVGSASVTNASFLPEPRLYGAALDSEEDDAYGEFALDFSHIPAEPAGVTEVEASGVIGGSVSGSGGASSHGNYGGLVQQRVHHRPTTGPMDHGMDTVGRHLSAYGSGYPGNGGGYSHPHAPHHLPPPFLPPQQQQHHSLSGYTHPHSSLYPSASIPSPAHPMASLPGPLPPMMPASGRVGAVQHHQGVASPVSGYNRDFMRQP